MYKPLHNFQHRLLNWDHFRLQIVHFGVNIFILLTVFGHAALLHTGTSRGVVHVLADIFFCVLLLSSVAPSLPVDSGVPDTREAFIKFCNNHYKPEASVPPCWSKY